MSGKQVTPETPEQDFLKKETVPNVVYVRVTEQVFKRLLKIAKENDSNMSEVARLCIESKLIEVEKLLKEIKELKREFKG